MEWPQWLQGGPFLEVSFLLGLKKEKAETIQEITEKFSKMKSKIEIVDINISEITDFFARGYPYDENNTSSLRLHSLRLRLYVYMSRKRKATLQIEVVSSNALMVNFWFYGDEFDESEWGQIGIKREEYDEFVGFLKELYSVYKFKIGGIAIEENVLGLFRISKIYPNELYRYENIYPENFLKQLSPFTHIIWNENYKKLEHITDNYSRIDNDGILIETQL